MSSPDFDKWESSSQIDPMMLRLLQKKYEKTSTPSETSPVKTRQLGVMYAAYIGISALVIVIILGAIRGTDADVILAAACRCLLVFCVIGYVAGKIAEICVQESAKSMIHDMLRRTSDHRNATANDSPEQE